VAREIGHVDVSVAEKSRLLAEIVFDEILGSQTKVRHRDTKVDYECNRLLDGAPWRQASHALSFEALTPLGDDYERLHSAKCILRSSEDIPSVPGELFAKFQTSFYSDPVDAAFKALGVE